MVICYLSFFGTAYFEFEYEVSSCYSKHIWLLLAKLLLGTASAFKILVARYHLKLAGRVATRILVIIRAPTRLLL